MSRPPLTPSIDPDVFDSYYWYKEELMDFARTLQVSTSGGKFEIHDRISYFLRTGHKTTPHKLIPTSYFDWSKENLTLDTVITDNYKNNQNVRKFFKAHLGDSFSFSITFMNWMKDHIGHSLRDAIKAYPTLKKARKTQEIPDHNQFNQYLRDFMEDNPSLTKQDASKCWLQVIKIPRPGSKGRGIRYSPHDIGLLNNIDK